MKEKFNQLVRLFLGTRLYLLLAPYLVFYTGVAANQAVLVANGGKFPVMVNDRAAKTFGFESDGFSVLQTPHHEAQKFTNTTLPRKSESRTSLPS